MKGSIREYRGYCVGQWSINLLFPIEVGKASPRFEKGALVGYAGEEIAVRGITTAAPSLLTEAYFI